MLRITARKRSLADIISASTVTKPAPKKNAYFQSAVADPTKNSATKTAAPSHKMSASMMPSAAPAPPPRAFNITVGTWPNQRTWLLPVSLLVKHSTFFAYMASYPSTPITTLELQDIDPCAFANFVDYMYSSIYSPNTRVPGFRYLRAGRDAAALGNKLGCEEYEDAGVRMVWGLVEGMGRVGNGEGGRSRSLIRASDIEWVCRNTAYGARAYRPKKEDESDDLDDLRRLFFDAVASHWSQREVAGMANEFDNAGDTVSWGHVYDKYHDFRERIEKSMGVVDGTRGRLLRPVEEYCSGGGGKKKGKNEGGADGDKKRALHMKTIRRRKPASEVESGAREVEDDGVLGSV